MTSKISANPSLRVQIAALVSARAMPTRGDEPASTSAGAVSQREVAALVYNYLRSNGFVKVRRVSRGRVASPSV